MKAKKGEVMLNIIINLIRNDWLKRPNFSPSLDLAPAEKELYEWAKKEIPEMINPAGHYIP